MGYGHASEKSSARSGSLTKVSSTYGLTQLMNSNSFRFRTHMGSLQLTTHPGSTTRYDDSLLLQTRLGSLISTHGSLTCAPPPTQRHGYTRSELPTFPLGSLPRPQTSKGGRTKCHLTSPSRLALSVLGRGSKYCLRSTVSENRS